MTFHQRLRMQRGLQWRRDWPSAAELRRVFEDWLILIAVVGVLLVAYGIVGRLDYEEELRQQAERQAAIKLQYRDAVLACLNNGYLLFDREAFECKAESLGVVR